MASNLESNESFDALIDLLASDNVAEDPRFNQYSSPGLRDDQGNLDLGKIHTFFAAGREGDYAITGNDPKSPEARRGEDPFSISLERNQEPATISASIPTSPDLLNFRASTIATKNSSTQDTQLLSLESPYSSIPTPSHDIGDSQQVSRIGIQERSLGQSQIPTDTFYNQSHQNGGMTSAMEPLDQALKLANEEVKRLRQQCDELLAKARVPDKKMPQASGTSNVPVEIAMLTEWEAKEALSNVLRALSLPASCLEENLVSLGASAHSPNTIPDIQRAVSFTAETDELIWKRLKYNLIPGAGPPAAVFDPQNISALQQRLSLWERIIRQAP
ncbi:hypothetical protein HWV62_11319 [Athelia sp. TMB]|nr:hypothetical protein HWV62_11319 [Athelia sp. TMB]